MSLISRPYTKFDKGLNKFITTINYSNPYLESIQRKNYLRNLIQLAKSGDETAIQKLLSLIEQKRTNKLSDQLGIDLNIRYK